MTARPLTAQSVAPATPQPTPTLTYRQLGELSPGFFDLLVEAATQDGKSPLYNRDAARRGLRQCVWRLIRQTSLPAGQSIWKVVAMAERTLYGLLPPTG